jgi:hypothetical protein
MRTPSRPRPSPWACSPCVARRPPKATFCPRIEREAPRRWAYAYVRRTTQAAGLAWALYPADKSASIPMGFEFEKEAVGENPQVTDEFAAAVKRG